MDVMELACSINANSVEEFVHYHYTEEHSTMGQELQQQRMEAEAKRPARPGPFTSCEELPSKPRRTKKGAAHITHPNSKKKNQLKHLNTLKHYSEVLLDHSGTSIITARHKKIAYDSPFFNSILLPPVFTV